MPADPRQTTSENAERALSAEEELIDRGKKLDAAIEALRIKVKAREVYDWQPRRHPDC